jgi:hypothetical protein
MTLQKFTMLLPGLAKVREIKGGEKMAVEGVKYMWERQGRRQGSRENGMAFLCLVFC